MRITILFRRLRITISSIKKATPAQHRVGKARKSQR